MSKDGFITLSRKILDWEWYQEPNMVHLFVHLLLKANYTPSKYQGELVDRGQLIFGRKVASVETGISEQSIRTCMERLQKCGAITIKSTNKFSIISICKFDTYQSMKKENNQPINQQLTIEVTNEQPSIQPTDNQQSTNNQPHHNIIPIKEERKEEKKIQAHVLPELNLQIEEFKKTHPGKYPDDLYSHFYDYWTAPILKGTLAGQPLWKKQEAWSLAGRLATWNSRNNKTPKTDVSTQSPAEAAKEILRKNGGIN